MDHGGIVTFFLFLFCYEINDGINEDKYDGKDDNNAQSDCA